MSGACSTQPAKAKPAIADSASAPAMIEAVRARLWLEANITQR